MAYDLSTAINSIGIIIFLEIFYTKYQWWIQEGAQQARAPSKILSTLFCFFKPDMYQNATK